MPLTLRAVQCLRVATAALLCFAAPAHAAQRCALGISPLTFGAYEAGTPEPVDATGTLSVRCTGSPASAVVVAISAGAGGDAGNRELQSGVDRLDYNLFVDAARTRVWGDGTGGTERVLAAAPDDDARGTRPREVDVPVYGRIFPWQDPAPGNYSDVVTISVEF